MCSLVGPTQTTYFPSVVLLCYLSERNLGKTLFLVLLSLFLLEKGVAHRVFHWVLEKNGMSNHAPPPLFTRSGREGSMQAI